MIDTTPEQTHLGQRATVKHPTPQEPRLGVLRRASQHAALPCQAGAELDGFRCAKSSTCRTCAASSSLVSSALITMRGLSILVCFKRGFDGPATFLSIAPPGVWPLQCSHPCDYMYHSLQERNTQDNRVSLHFPGRTCAAFGFDRAVDPPSVRNPRIFGFVQSADVLVGPRLCCLCTASRRLPDKA